MKFEKRVFSKFSLRKLLLYFYKGLKKKSLIHVGLEKYDYKLYQTGECNLVYNKSTLLALKRDNH